MKKQQLDSQEKDYSLESAKNIIVKTECKMFKDSTTLEYRDPQNCTL